MSKFSTLGQVFRQFSLRWPANPGLQVRATNLRLNVDLGGTPLTIPEGQSFGSLLASVLDYKAVKRNKSEYINMLNKLSRNVWFFESSICIRSEFAGTYWQGERFTVSIYRSLFLGLCPQVDAASWPG